MMIKKMSWTVFVGLLLGLACAACSSSGDDEVIDDTGSGEADADTDTDTDSDTDTDTDGDVDTDTDTGKCNAPDNPVVGDVCIPLSVDSDAADCAGDPLVYQGGIDTPRCRYTQEPASNYYCGYWSAAFDPNLCPDPASVPAQGDACDVWPMSDCYFDNGDGTNEKLDCIISECGVTTWNRTTVGGTLASCDACDMADDKCNYTDDLRCGESATAGAFECQSVPFKPGDQCCGTAGPVGMFKECTIDRLGWDCGITDCGVGIMTRWICTCTGWSAYTH